MEDAPEPTKRWLACFHLKTNLRVKSSDPATLCDVLGAEEIVLTNVEYDSRNVYFLDLKLVFCASDIDEAHEVADDMAEECAYVLSFVSGAAVRVDRPIYLIHWDLGLATRDQYVYIKHPVNDPVDALDAEMMRSVAAVAASNGSSAAKAAIRWYGRGTRAFALEDQFQYYLFTIEILASAEQSDIRVVDRCPRCRGELTCTQCGKPEHRPFPKQKMRLLLVELGMSDGLVDAVIELRNLIAHGTERRVIDAEMRKRSSDFEMEKAVAVMGQFALRALHRALDLPEHDPPLTFYYLENLEKRTLVGKVHMKIGLKGDPNNPQFEDVWMPALSVVLTDPVTGAEETFLVGGTDVPKAKADK